MIDLTDSYVSVWDKPAKSYQLLKLALRTLSELSPPVALVIIRWFRRKSASSIQECIAVTEE